MWLLGAGLSGLYHGRPPSSSSVCRGLQNGKCGPSSPCWPCGFVPPHVVRAPGGTENSPTYTTTAAQGVSFHVGSSRSRSRPLASLTHRSPRQGAPGPNVPRLAVWLSSSFDLWLRPRPRRLSTSFFPAVGVDASGPPHSCRLTPSVCGVVVVCVCGCACAGRSAVVMRRCLL